MYPDVLSDHLLGKERSIIGGPMTIHLKEGEVKPLHCTKTKQIPKHWAKMADNMIEELLKGGVIVKEDNPTDWINRGFFVPKPGNPNALRLVTDFRYLNKFVRRPIHPFPCAQAIRQNLDSDSKFFVKLDAVHGYFQIPLTEESSKLTGNTCETTLQLM